MKKNKFEAFDIDTDLINRTTYPAGTVVPEYVQKITSDDPEYGRFFAERMVFGVDVLVERYKSWVDIYPLECLMDDDGKFLIDCESAGEIPKEKHIYMNGAPTRFSMCRKGCWQPHSPQHISVTVKPSCAECHAPDLENFMTSKRDDRKLCIPCFNSRVDRQIAKEVS